jgi:hypothetical protein
MPSKAQWTRQMTEKESNAKGTKSIVFKMRPDQVSEFTKAKGAE